MLGEQPLWLNLVKKDRKRKHSCFVPNYPIFLCSDAGGTATESSQEGPETETLLRGRENWGRALQALQQLRPPISFRVSHKVTYKKISSNWVALGWVVADTGPFFGPAPGFWNPSGSSLINQWLYAEKLNNNNNKIVYLYPHSH